MESSSGWIEFNGNPTDKQELEWNIGIEQAMLIIFFMVIVGTY